MSAPERDSMSAAVTTLVLGAAAARESIKATETIETNDTIEAKEKGQPPLRSDQPTEEIIGAAPGNFKFFRSRVARSRHSVVDVTPLHTTKTVGAGCSTAINRPKPLVVANFGDPSIRGSLTPELPTRYGNRPSSLNPRGHFI